jgi:type I restriction enzyme S subunit
MPTAYVFFLVRSLVETREYKRHWNDLINKDVIVATRDCAERFALFAQDVFAQIDHLTKKNLNLRRTRDLLLPKLISGEVDVSEMEVAGE